MVRKAFTVVEVLVMTTVFVVIAATALANFTFTGGGARLRNAANELAANIKRAQTLAYVNLSLPICSDFKVCGSGSSCDAGMPTGCTDTPILSYGVALNVGSDSKTYVIFADANYNGVYDAGEAISGGTKKLPSGVTFTSITPPANNPLIFSYNAGNTAPFVYCSPAPNCTTVITLRADNVTVVRKIEVSVQTGKINSYEE